MNSLEQLGMSGRTDDRVIQALDLLHQVFGFETAISIEVEGMEDMSVAHKSVTFDARIDAKPEFGTEIHWQSYEGADMISIIEFFE